MLWLKTCPKCGGDLFTDWDADGSYVVTCLQCGCYIAEDRDKGTLVRRMASEMMSNRTLLEKPRRQRR